MPFKASETKLAGLKLLHIRRFEDARGWFMETFKQSEFAEKGIDATFVQDNCSRSSRGVLRGLHFQRPPHAQGKLILPLHGELFDVAVDIRRGSPTYGQWQGFTLRAEDAQALWIPPGFAHGFAVLSESVLFWYKVTAEYAPASEGGLRWNDPALGIRWPIADPILAPRDTTWPAWEAFVTPFE